MSKLKPLTPAERERGWVVFTCPDHGPLVATMAEAIVTCKCRKPAHPTRDGKRLTRAQLGRLKSVTPTPHG